MAVIHYVKRPTLNEILVYAGFLLSVSVSGVLITPDARVLPQVEELLISIPDNRAVSSLFLTRLSYGW